MFYARHCNRNNVFVASRVSRVYDCNCLLYLNHLIDTKQTFQSEQVALLLLDNL